MKKRNYILLVLFFSCFLVNEKNATAQSCSIAPNLNATWTCNAVSLFWSSNPNAVFYEYKLDSAGVIIAQDTTSATSAFISGLSPSTLYIGWVRSVCGANDTSVWNPYTFTTMPCANCANAPTPAVAWACNSVNFTWTANTNALAYEYKLDSAGVTLFQGSTTATGVALSPLTQMTPYIASVRSICGAGDTSAWVISTFTTSPCGACVAPGPITALVPSCDSVFFGWNTMTGNAGYEYAVTLDTLLPQPNTWTSTTNAYGYQGGLFSDTTYYIQVRSNCVTMGYSSITKLAITTPPCPTAGIPITPEKKPVILYPNPVNNQLNLILDKPDKNATLEIMTIEGKIIKRMTNLSEHESIHVQGLPDGMYLLRYKYGSRIIHYKFNKL